jgi:predicted nuclease with TOPRIM domain
MAESLLDSLTEAESQPQADSGAQAAGPKALTVSADDFSALEERVLRAVALVKRERQTRVAAEERATLAETLFDEQSQRLEKTEGEVAALKAERDAVRQRVERLLSQLDELEQ